MILNRIGTAIRNQDWFVVFIELMIVVVGIYIGLQVDDWQKARQDRADEGRFLEALLQETRHNIGQVEWRENAIELDAAAMRNVVSALKAGNLNQITDDEAYEALCEWFTIIPPSYQTATYDELVSTGQLDIITNETLRRQLQASKALRERYTFERTIFWDMHRDRALELAPHMTWQMDENYFETISCQFNLAGLAGDPQALSAIVQLIGTHVVMKSFYSREKTALLEIEETLVQEIGEGIE